MIFAFLLGCCEPLGRPGGEISILTYNVHGLPPEITGDDTTARMEQIGPLLKGFDIVGLQEDWLDENHAVLDEAVDYPTRDRETEKLDDRAYGKGLAMFAARESVASAGDFYTTCYGTIENASDCFASKGWRMLRLDLLGAEVDVYNTHLEAGGGPEDDAARGAQVDALIDAIANESADRAVIFVGDTNLEDTDPEDEPLIRKLEDETGLVNACVALDCPEPERIDRVMFRGSGNVSVDADSWSVAEEFADSEGVPLSDHEPIAVTLAWGGPMPPSCGLFL